MYFRSLIFDIFLNWVMGIFVWFVCSLTQKIQFEFQNPDLLEEFSLLPFWLPLVNLRVNPGGSLSSFEGEKPTQGCKIILCLLLYSI